MQCRGRRDSNKMHFYAISWMGSRKTYHLENDAKLGIMPGTEWVQNKFIINLLLSSFEMNFDESMGASTTTLLLAFFSGEGNTSMNFKKVKKKPDKLHKMELIASRNRDFWWI